MRHTYKTQGVCPKTIEFDLNGNVVTNIQYNGGCNGNLSAIQKLVNGFTVEQIVETLGGMPCGRRPTSCADQLAKAVQQAYDESKA